MIRRAAEDTLKRLAAQFPVVGITGPRQSGKTTLTKAVFPAKPYVTLDDRAMRQIATASPRDFLAAFPNGAIIDEAQKAPGLFEALKIDVDAAPAENGKYILTGSSQFRLQSNMTDSLAGRAAFLKLLPFSIAELKAAGRLPDTAYDLIYNGQYPPLYDETRHFLPEDWYESYLDTYVDLDVRDQINPGNLSTFRRFIQVLAANSGEIFSMEKIGREIGVSGPTVKHWLGVLESSYIIHFLEPDSNNLGKSVVKTPKLYFVDTGLLCHLLRFESRGDMILSRHKGAVVETFAVAEFLKHRMNQGKKAKLTYYRTAKGEMEVDMIADWRDTFAVEIKSSTDPEVGKASKARKYAADRKDAKSAVFYLGDVSLELDGTPFVSWRDWERFFR
ncbi:MAG: ATP-binding protein [Clostridia bacterium]|nr:ATP-binding protein [Clostridia bacterium]